MTRTNAGSTLANQYAPPFVITDSITTNWQLRWNADLIAFEAFDPDENVIAAGFDSIEQALFVNTNNQQVFTIPWGVDTTVTSPKASLYVTINGVKQHTDTYSIAAGTNTTTVTLGGATGLGDDVEIIGLQATDGATVELTSSVGDGTLNQSVLLSWLAPSEQSLLITIEGIKQDTSAYSISPNGTFTQTTVTFDGTITVSDAIEIVGITTSGETPASPVEVVNLDSGLADATVVPAANVRAEIFSTKRVIGTTQLFDLRDIIAETGSNITLAYPVAGGISIAATQPTFTQSGGTGVLTVVNPAVDPLEFRVLKTLADGDTAEGGILLTIDNDDLVIRRNFGYVSSSLDDFNMGVTDRVAGLTNFTTTKTVTLPAIASVRAGERITIKDEAGGATATFTVTIDTVGAELIDTAINVVGINSAFGYITFYSNGTNYFILEQG